VWAVVVNWNGGRGNLDCLASILAAGIEEEHVVFVDNASRDGSAALVRAAHPRLRQIAHESNLGFGEGANRGAREALAGGARAVYFVNNDVLLPPDSIAPLAAVLFESEQRGIVGPRVLLASDPGRLWCAGGALTWRQNLSTLRGHLQADGARWRDRRPVDYVAGCALLARRELLESVGLFDPDYFAYSEDVELGLRARRAGWEVLSVGDQSCLHAPSSATGGGYSPRRKYMQGLNSVRFLKRWGGIGQWARFLLFDVSSLPPLFLLGLARGRARAVAAKALGILHGLAGRRVEARVLEEGGTFLW
jgi:GT2 family glycosyltransferase